jgi:predicted porin
MKKSLFAIAAVTAFAGAAQAQSSVTVYGILDVGYIGASSRVSNSAGTAANGFNNGVAKKTSNQFGSSAETSSRLGFKGVEDLGGGTSAFFTAEFALSPNDQSLNGNKQVGANVNGTAAETGGLTNRQTFVGLKKNGIGQLAVGTQYTTVFNALAATDPGQTNNTLGSVIYPSTSGGNNADQGNTAALTARTSNTLSVKSDKFGGFTGSAFATLNNKNTTEVSTNNVATVGGNTNASGWGLGADFAIQKFYVAAAYQSLKQLTTVGNTTPLVAGTTGNAPAVWSQAQGNGATTVGGGAYNTTDNQFYAGATYDFGILKAYANYISRKATATASSNYYVKRAGEQIGVRSYITPTIEAWASAGVGRYTAMGSGTPTQNFNAWQLGSNYYLSKRTNLYAIYGQTMTSSGTGTYTSGSATVSTQSAAASNYAIGVRHTF